MGFVLKLPKQLFSGRVRWRILVANLVTYFQDLVANVENLGSLAPELDTIFMPWCCPTLKALLCFSANLSALSSNIPASQKGGVMFLWPLSLYSVAHVHYCGKEKTASHVTLKRRKLWTLKIFLECLLCFDQSHAKPCNRRKQVGFSVTKSSWFSSCFERPSS